MDVPLTAVTWPDWTALVWKPPPGAGATNWPCTAPPGKMKPPNGNAWCWPGPRKKGGLPGRALGGAAEPDGVGAGWASRASAAAGADGEEVAIEAPTTPATKAPEAIATSVSGCPYRRFGGGSLGGVTRPSQTRVPRSEERRVGK